MHGPLGVMQRPQGFPRRRRRRRHRNSDAPSVESNDVKPERDGEVRVGQSWRRLRRLRFLILDRARRELFAAGGRVVGSEREGNGRVGPQTLKGSC